MKVGVSKDEKYPVYSVEPNSGVFGFLEIEMSQFELDRYRALEEEYELLQKIIACRYEAAQKGRSA